MNSKDIQKIARILTEDPDIFNDPVVSEGWFSNAVAKIRGKNPRETEAPRAHQGRGEAAGHQSSPPDPAAAAAAQGEQMSAIMRELERGRKAAGLPPRSLRVLPGGWRSELARYRQREQYKEQQQQQQYTIQYLGYRNIRYTGDDFHFSVTIGDRKPEELSHRVFKEIDDNDVSSTLASNLSDDLEDMLGWDKETTSKWCDHIEKMLDEDPRFKKFRDDMDEREPPDYDLEHY